MWAQAFTGLQTSINSKITVLKKLEVVDTSVKKLYPMIQDGVDPIQVEAFQNSVSNLARRAEGLPKGVDGFFHVLLTVVMLCSVTVLCDPKLGCKVVERVQS